MILNISGWSILELSDSYNFSKNIEKEFYHTLGIHFKHTYI